MKVISFFQKNKQQTGDPFLVPENEIRDRDLSGELANRWAESNSLEALADKKETKKEFLSSFFGSKHLTLISFFFIILLAVLFARLFFLQVVKGDYYYSLAEGNRIRIEPLPSQRGLFIDVNKEPLVENIPYLSLELIPADLPAEKQKREAVFQALDSLAEIPASDAALALSGIPLYTYQAVPIKDDINYETALRVKMHSQELPGVRIKVGYKRHYLVDSSFSHLLGYTGKINPEELKKYQPKGYLLTDSLGKTGLELSWEEALRGQYGKKQIEVDALGKEIKIIDEQEALPGDNLLLSLNGKLQKRAEEALQAALKNAQVDRGAVIALNPQNGEILALVSLPAFNNNDFVLGIEPELYKNLTEDKNHPLYARAIAGQYPPGSTIKPLISAAALQEAVITPRTTVNSVGGISIGQWFFPDWRAGGHGLIDVKSAIANSVNTFYYYVGGGYGDFEGLGLARLTKYMKLFGLGEPLGIDLPNEASGFVPSEEWKREAKNEPWYIGDTYHISIGQGDLLVTPLQVASWTAAIANGGIIYKPRLVKEILDAGGQSLKIIEPRVIREGFIAPEHLEVVREGMRQAVTEGSARRLADLPMAVAGKTGTAQWHSQKDYHAWFACFAPYENPKIVLTVLLEEAGGGEVHAIPAAKEILQWWFENVHNPS